jgi:signal transduction histidine kinase
MLPIRTALMVEEVDRSAIHMILLGLGHQVAVWTLFAMAGLPTSRLIALIVAFALFALIQTVVKRRFVRSRNAEQGFLALALMAQFFMVGQMELTGGIHSPYLAGLPVTIIVPVVLFGPHGIGRNLLCSIGALVMLLVLVPRSIVGPPITTWHYGVIALIIFSWSIWVVRLVVTRMADVNERAACAIEDLHEERVCDAEGQARRLQSVGARVAHELKNPLAAIKGLVQLVARGNADERTQQRLQVVQSEIARMEVILAEYLSFSRPLEDLAPTPIDLAEVARDAATVVSGRAETGKITVELRAESTPVIADRRRLKETLLNLLSNAIEATPPGGTVAIATRPDDAGGGVLVVTDSGRGIEPAHLARLGASFFTTRDGGTGLGVVLAQGVIRQHGGDITWSSEPGRGTTVTITLPAQPAAGAKLP